MAASTASTDKALYHYGADTSLLDGDALLPGLLSAPAGEDPLASAERVLTLDPVLRHRLSTCSSSLIQRTGVQRKMCKYLNGAGH